jgi:hypothetical protein
MPRPRNGYQNAAGEPIPGTHDPIRRYADKTALMVWAHQRGEQGLPLWGKDAIDIGRTVHAMADLDLQDAPDAEIHKVAADAGLPREDFDKAMRSFAAFRQWRIACHVIPIATEESLVNEEFQYGGTPDLVAIVEGKVALVEFKTSVKPFPDHLVAMAAHAFLWNEAHPDRKIETFHWLGLPKDGSGFQHHQYGNLHPQWEIFQRYLALYRLEKKGIATKPAKAAVKTVIPSPKSQLTAPADGLDIPAFLQRAPLRLVSSQDASTVKPKRQRKPRKPKTAPQPAPVRTCGVPAIKQAPPASTWSAIKRWFHVA